MTYRGRMSDGKVVLEDRVELPDGTEVEIQPVKRRRNAKRSGKKTATLYERLEAFVGQADGLPADMSLNHDHYLYGVPKRK